MKRIVFVRACAAGGSGKAFLVNPAALPLATSSPHQTSTAARLSLAARLGLVASP